MWTNDHDIVDYATTACMGLGLHGETTVMLTQSHLNSHMTLWIMQPHGIGSTLAHKSITKLSKTLMHTQPRTRAYARRSYARMMKHIATIRMSCLYTSGARNSNSIMGGHTRILENCIKYLQGHCLHFILVWS